MNFKVKWKEIELKIDCDRSHHWFCWVHLTFLHFPVLEIAYVIYIWNMLRLILVSSNIHCCISCNIQLISTIEYVLYILNENYGIQMCSSLSSPANDFLIYSYCIWYEDLRSVILFWHKNTIGTVCWSRLKPETNFMEF